MAKTTTKLGVLVVLALSIASAAFAQSESSPETQIVGTWEGLLPPPKGKANRVLLKIWRDRGYLLARMYSPDQDDKEYIVEVVLLKGRNLVLDLPAIQARYDATLSEAGSEIEGNWTQRAIVVPLAFRRTASR